MCFFFSVLVHSSIVLPQGVTGSQLGQVYIILQGRVGDTYMVNMVNVHVRSKKQINATGHASPAVLVSCLFLLSQPSASIWHLYPVERRLCSLLGGLD